MKYVMFRKLFKGGGAYYVPIVFPDMLVHIMVADSMTAKGAPLEGYMPVSAGNISPIDWEPFGESTTLKMSPHPRDKRILLMNDYGGAYSDDEE